MASNFRLLRDYVEPAHPEIVRQFEDLVELYKTIKEKYQTQIDQAFDEISRQIGFVVTTTLPVKYEENMIVMAADHLRGTLFEQKFGDLLNQGDLLRRGRKNEPSPEPWVQGGQRFYIFWYAALRLKLRTEWMEPAHFPRPWLEPAHFPGEIQQGFERATESQRAIRWEVREPPHWFDPSFAITAEEAVVIEAIDQVYSELRLVDQIAAARQVQRRQFRPGIREPAHFRQVAEILEADPGGGFAQELNSLLRRYGY